MWRFSSRINHISFFLFSLITFLVLLFRSCWRTILTHWNMLQRNIGRKKKKGKKKGIHNLLKWILHATKAIIQPFETIWLHRTAGSKRPFKGRHLQWHSNEAHPHNKAFVSPVSTCSVDYSVATPFKINRQQKEAAGQSDVRPSRGLRPSACRLVDHSWDLISLTHAASLPRRLLHQR